MERAKAAAVIIIAIVISTSIIAMIIHHQRLTMTVLPVLFTLIGCQLTVGLALQDTTLSPSSSVSEDNDASAPWMSVYQQQFNLDSDQTYNLPLPSPFRLLEQLESSATEHRRTERKLSAYLYPTTLQQGSVLAESFHQIGELNPHARSINSELENAFATVASSPSSSDQQSENDQSLQEAELTAATNDLNVDQSPTDGASNASNGSGNDGDGIMPFDWHRYFSMDFLTAREQQRQEDQQPYMTSPPPPDDLTESSTDEVYQTERSTEELNKSL